MPETCLKLLICGLLICFACSCAMKRQPQLDSAHDDVPTAESSKLLAMAEACFERADTAEKLESCRQQYLAVLAENPGDYTALTKLSTISILSGTAYTDSMWAKSNRFLQAMAYAEQAMLTNEAFRQRIAAGAPLWDAVDALGATEVEAMFFWVTALQYEFKEGMTLPGKIVNLKWLQRALPVLDRIEQVAPDFGGGGVEFARVICYYALPERYGGSKERGDNYMRKAVEGNTDWLLPRWARGKYYYAITDQQDKSRRELNWVARQDIDNYRDPYPWKKHFLENADQLLR